MRTPDDVYIAYQVTGEGPVDIVWQFDFTGNVDVAWEDPVYALLLPGLASFARLILYDRRGTGLSSRNVSPPDLETRVADLRVVLDAVESERPVLAGALEGGTPNVLLAASDPERVHSIVWWTPSARSVWSPDYPCGVRPEFVEATERELENWGTLRGPEPGPKGGAVRARPNRRGDSRVREAQPAHDNSGRCARTHEELVRDRRSPDPADGQGSGPTSCNGGVPRPGRGS